MGDENPIRTLEDYSKPRHEGYRLIPSCWNDPRDFAKPVKAIALPHDVPSTSDRRLIELEKSMVPTTLSIAWKIPNKPLLNMHPRVPMKRELRGRLEKLMFIEIIRDDDEPHNERSNEDNFPTVVRLLIVEDNSLIHKTLGFYKECLELGPEYVTGLDDEGEVT
ncbi:hypothetical protein Tco_0010276 [Tanacetum coccineum]